MRKYVTRILSGMAGLLLMAGCGMFDSGNTRYSADELLPYLPAGSQAVLTIDVQRMMEEDFFRDQVKAPEDASENSTLFAEQREEWQKRLGLDPAEDIFMVLGTYTPAPDTGDTQLGLIMNARYQPEKMLESIDAEEKLQRETENYRDHAVHHIFEGSTGSRNQVLTFTFLTPSLLATGQTSAVKAILDCYDDEQPSIIENEEWIAKFQEVDQTSMAWLVGRLDSEAVRALSGSQSQSMPLGLNLDKFQWIVATLDYRQFVLRGRVAVFSPDSESNQKIAAALNGLKAMAGFRDDSLGKLMNSIFINADDTRVNISFNLPQEVLQELSQTYRNDLEKTVTSF